MDMKRTGDLHGEIEIRFVTWAAEHAEYARGIMVKNGLPVERLKAIVPPDSTSSCKASV